MALHILVVEDDATVLTVLVAILEDAGFTVTATDSGLAMRDLTAEKPAIDAVVLDCRMPGEPSPQLALHAKSLRLPVVMISGIIKGRSKIPGPAVIDLVSDPTHRVFPGGQRMEPGLTLREVISGSLAMRFYRCRVRTV